MIKAVRNLGKAKETVKDCYKQEVDVKVNLGRNKIISYSGVLTEIYPALFTVSPFDKTFTGKTSYSYSEMLCGNVIIKRKA